jgi:small subunit ribosomal protein S1
MNSENITPSENEPMTSVNEAGQAAPENTTEPEQEAVTAPEIIPSMDDYKEQLESSFRKLKEGDIIKGTVIGISESEVTLDLGYYTEGIIKLEELSNDPRFSIKADIIMGEEIYATIIEEDDGHGHILLSRKRADDILAWEH